MTVTNKKNNKQHSVVGNCINKTDNDFSEGKRMILYSDQLGNIYCRE